MTDKAQRIDYVTSAQKTLDLANGHEGDKQFAWLLAAIVQSNLAIAEELRLFATSHKQVAEGQERVAEELKSIGDLLSRDTEGRASR